MTGRKLSLLLFLMPALSISSKDERQLLVRGGGGEEVIPVCPNGTAIMLVVCKIRTDKEQGDECRLLYRHHRGFESNCSSGFTLTLVQNQTAFLHLSNLTPEDSGNCTCECSLVEGIHTLYLNITVTDDGEEPPPPSPPTGSPRSPGPDVVLISLSICLCIIFITIFLLLFVHQKTQQRRRHEPRSCHLYTETQTPETYITFIQRENEIYST